MDKNFFLNKRKHYHDSPKVLLTEMIQRDQMNNNYLRGTWRGDFKPRGTCFNKYSYLNVTEVLTHRKTSIDRQEGIHFFSTHNF